MKIQYFIFNYDHFDNAKKLFDTFTTLNCDTYLLSCESPRDPSFEETDKIKKLPNIYYSGQWNEALRLLKPDTDVMFITNADVKIDLHRLLPRMNNFYIKHDKKVGIYSPNVRWTPWTYNPWLLEDIEDGIKNVVATDSVTWSLSTDLARKIGSIDLNINRFGWGIEILAAWYSYLEGRYVVRDYKIRCEHPRHTAYDRNQADSQWRKMAHLMGLREDFWNYYNSRYKYEFDWQGNDDPILFETRKIKLF